MLAVGRLILAPEKHRSFPLQADNSPRSVATPDCCPAKARLGNIAVSPLKYHLARARLESVWQLLWLGFQDSLLPELMALPDKVLCRSGLWVANRQPAFRRKLG